MFNGCVKQTNNDRRNDCRSQVDQKPGEPRFGRINNGVIEVILLNPAETHNVFFMLFIDHVDHVVDGDNADHTPPGSDDRGRYQVALTENKSDFFLVGIRRNGLGLSLHNINQLDVPCGTQEPAQGHNPKRMMRRVDHEDIEEPFRQNIGGTDIVDRFPDRPKLGGSDEFPLHHPAGRILWMRQGLFDQAPVFFGNCLKDFFLFVLVQLFDEHHRIVGIEF